MNDYVLKSNFKDDIRNFLKLKHSLGYKYTLGEKLIKQFDNLCFSRFFNETVLTKDIALEWATPRKNESCSSVENRIVVVREFARYLNNIEKQAFIIPTTYIPKKQKYKSYIYTNAELRRIFDVIDNKKYGCYHKNTYMVFPVLLRFLYCCGLRISEALNLKVENIDLVNGIISIYEAKNNNDRLIVISDELKNICIEYSTKMHSDSRKDDFFFYTKNKRIPIVQTTLRKSFRTILNFARIEKSKQNNPRIHDFRHTFAVNCLKKFVKENKDLTAYLPILKTYMGHSKFKSTEYYLKLTNDMYPDILDKVNSYTNDAIPRIGGAYEK